MSGSQYSAETPDVESLVLQRTSFIWNAIRSQVLGEHPRYVTRLQGVQSDCYVLLLDDRVSLLPRLAFSAKKASGEHIMGYARHIHPTNFTNADSFPRSRQDPAFGWHSVYVERKADAITIVERTTLEGSHAHDLPNLVLGDLARTNTQAQQTAMEQLECDIYALGSDNPSTPTKQRLVAAANHIYL